MIHVSDNAKKAILKYKSEEGSPILCSGWA